MTSPLPIIETEESRKRREAKRAYLEALPEYPDFVLPNDAVDGLLPSAKVQSWESLLTILQRPGFKKTKNDLVYRGHAGHDWQLASTLGRLFEAGDIPSDKRKQLLRQFKLSMRGRGYDLTPLQHDDNEIWAIGQHHGLKTPLLDWTRSPFVALFFAFAKFESQAETDENPSRAIFCLNKTRIEEDLGEDYAGRLFLEPEDTRNSRLVNQSGLFTITPDERDSLVSSLVNRLDEADLLGSVDGTKIGFQDDEQTKKVTAVTEGRSGEATFTVSDQKRAKILAQYIFKLHIPNSMQSRKDCLEALRQMNIHHGNLFPDPSGASNFCNDWLERLLEDEKQEVADEAKKQDDRKIAAAIAPGTSVDISNNVSTLLKAFLEFHEGDANALEKEISRSVNEKSSLDWSKFPSKKAIVKLAISRAIANGPGNIKTDRNIGELINLLLEKYASASEHF